MSEDASVEGATPDVPSDPLLSVEELEAGYETGQVLVGVDLAVGDGELVSLLGRNGAGKTTTLRAIAGATVPRVLAGDVRLDGRSLVGRAAYDIAAMGLTVLLIEHDMDVVLSVSDRITVLDRGRVITTGPPEQVQENPDVQDAYLGGIREAL